MANVSKSMVVKPTQNKLLSSTRCRCVTGSEGYRVRVHGLDSVAWDN
jgi:hypothetical protein